MSMICADLEKLAVIDERRSTRGRGALQDCSVHVEWCISNLLELLDST